MRPPVSIPELFVPPAHAAVWQGPSPRVAPAAAPVLALSRAAGLLLIGTSAAFLAVFAWLAQHFGYPDVLDAPAREVLPALLALGGTGRAVWAVYAVLPLCLMPAVALSMPRLAPDSRDRALAHVALTLQVIASLSMTIGLARWSTLQWVLATQASTAGAGGDSLTTLFVISEAMNAFLGNALGEFVGELALYGVFAALAVLSWRRGWRVLCALGTVTVLAGWMGMLRNITPLVDPVAEVSNTLLPMYLIALGGRLMRAR